MGIKHVKGPLAWGEGWETGGGRSVKMAFTADVACTLLPPVH